MFGHPRHSRAGGNPGSQTVWIPAFAGMLLLWISVERDRVGGAAERLGHLAEGILGERHDLVVGVHTLGRKKGLGPGIRGPGHDHVGLAAADLPADRKAVALADYRKHDTPRQRVRPLLCRKNGAVRELPRKSSSRGY